MSMLFAPTGITFRPHQQEAVDAICASPEQFAYVEMCVASGKSLTMAGVAARALGRVLIVAHTEELVKQDTEACQQIGLIPGICCAALKQTMLFSKLTVGSVGTVVNRIGYFRDVGVVLIDEVHRARMEEYKDGTASEYLKLKNALPHAVYRGFTATGWREDGTGALDDSFGPKLFTYTFAQALEDGIVKLLRAVDADVPEFDTKGLKTNAQGEWTGKELSNRGILLAPYHVPAFLGAMQREHRSRALIFACDIDHAQELERICRTKYCIDARAVHTGRDANFRRDSVAAFRAGKFPVMISVGMFNVGFDVPDIDFMALCRPMKSRLLYAQSLGRGARVSEFANDCVVCDFGGNIIRHGAMDMLQARMRVHQKIVKKPEEIQLKLPGIIEDRTVGADLRQKARAGVLVSAQAEPKWVSIIGPGRFISTGRYRFWILATDIGDVKWFSAFMPQGVHHAYAEYGRYGWTAACVLDANGNLHKT